MIGDIYKNYPDKVQKLVSLTLEVMQKDPESMEDFDLDILEEMLCELALEKFVKEIDMIWLEEEMLELLQMAATRTSIKKLKDLGLIDSIENEHGEEVVWLTEKGKGVASITQTLQSSPPTEKKQ